jgi:hypothetical protein
LKGEEEMNDELTGKMVRQILESSGIDMSDPSQVEAFGRAFNAELGSVVTRTVERLKGAPQAEPQQDISQVNDPNELFARAFKRPAKTTPVEDTRDVTEINDPAELFRRGFHKGSN